MNIQRSFLLTLLFAAALAVSAADKPKKPELPTYLTVETAGPDYSDQGEYSNDWGGAQAIALGDSQFRLVIYQGGLPGAGWDPTAATKTTVEGKREGDKIIFAPAPNGFKHSLANCVLTTVNTDGAE